MVNAFDFSMSDLLFELAGCDVKIRLQEVDHNIKFVG